MWLKQFTDYQCNEQLISSLNNNAQRVREVCNWVYEPYEDDPYYPDPSPGTNPGYVDPEPDEVVVEIIDSLQGYPCAQEVLKELLNLKNKIADWLDREFSTAYDSDKDLYFRAVTTLPDTLDGYWNTNNQIGTTQTITLNGNMLLEASKEYILATMYHEVLHGFLFLEHQRLGDAQFGIIYSGANSINIGGNIRFTIDHDTYSYLLSDLQAAIMSFSPNLSSYDAMALAKGGVVSNMNSIEKSINHNHKIGNAGTKCDD